MNTNIKKPAAKHVALVTIVPFVVGLWSTQVTLHIFERYGQDPTQFLLVGWCVLLGVSAAWLNQVVFGRTKTLFPFLAAVLVILLVWLWERLAFTTLVPGSGLAYGYFLEPNAAKARFWVLTCLLRVGLFSLSICFVAVLVSSWREGFRTLLACIIPWWLSAFLIFLLPSIYISAQGEASEFI
jgi:hypothetical protein